MTKFLEYQELGMMKSVNVYKEFQQLFFFYFFFFLYKLIRFFCKFINYVMKLNFKVV